VGTDEGATCPAGLGRGQHALGAGCWVRLAINALGFCIFPRTINACLLHYYYLNFSSIEVPFIRLKKCILKQYSLVSIYDI